MLMAERADENYRWSDGHASRWKASRIGWREGTSGCEFIVAAAEVLHERVPGGL
jgi:hypothetical protein